ncbi:serpin family protein [Agathobaculum sp.]|uniref:serpin family protein n=1 Tax=Agathobaculum sp. TaxID=2048138 RepID=UPI002A7F58BD|nr:serpin family protein [Agathobaculum sp.]MDY3618534.1 serpin family protein [Agathobaculum sp.]
MKKRILVLALTLCIALPVLAGAMPDHVIGRGMFVELLAQASGEDLAQYENADCPFSDVGKENTAVRWAYAKWLVNGDENSLFRPDDRITRQEAAAILGRYLEYQYTTLPPGCGTGAPSMQNIPKWAQDGVKKCWMYGVIDTGDRAEFYPNAEVMDSEAETWIANANKLAVGAIGEPETLSFADSLVQNVEREGNFMLSPYSARMCLAMLANGARGQTQRELLNALGIAELTAFNREVKSQLETYDGYARIMSLDTANSIWLNQTQYGGVGAFKPAFEAAMRENYRAEVRKVTDDNSVEQVNQWVKDKTKGKIPTILTEDDRDFVTALVNAVYFKAAWQNEFNEAATKKEPFTNADGTKTQTDFMHQTDMFGYYSTPGIEAVKMDYRNYAVDNEAGDNWETFHDADFSMYLIKAAGKLNAQHFLDSATFSDSQVQVAVPKFKIEFSAALNDALKALGVKTVYDAGRADLSGIASSTPQGNLFLDTVLQKTYIVIDEKGTEAAAVTAAMNAGGAMPSRRPPLVREFTADSPFWFAIRDNANGEILFVGRYESAK